VRIHDSSIALFAWRQMQMNDSQVARSIERLSSGSRINRAADDVAGLAMSERIRTQIRGLNKAAQNITDGISVVQVAESAMNEISSMLQRGRELALMAGNGILNADQMKSLQIELDGITAEIDRIAGQTEFNSRKVLGGDGQQVSQLVDGLRRSWLAESEKLVEAGYGLTAPDGTPLQIVADATGARPAYVQATYDGSGNVINLEMHINLQAMQNLTLPNGGTRPQYADRIIAHEMTHAVMDVNMNTVSLASWFKEGSAEFICGAEDRLASDLGRVGGVANLVGELSQPWTGSSEQYSAGYAAVRYLDSLATGGIKAVMARLKAGDTLDQAIFNTTAGAGNPNYADTAAFLTDFQGAAGQAFISSLNLTDALVGAATDGTAEAVVPDSNTDTWSPLAHFNVVWPENGLLSPQEPISLQVGFNVGERVGIPDLKTDTYDLHLVGLDLAQDHDAVLRHVDDAIRSVTSLRSELGAIQNRLEHSYNVTVQQAEILTAAESRIRDADIAEEMAGYAKRQVMLQASTAMLAQVNSLRRDHLRMLLGQ
jgi:flagellin